MVKLHDYRGHSGLHSIGEVLLHIPLLHACFPWLHTIRISSSFSANQMTEALCDAKEEDDEEEEAHPTGGCLGNCHTSSSIR